MNTMSETLSARALRRMLFGTAAGCAVLMLATSPALAADADAGSGAMATAGADGDGPAASGGTVEEVTVTGIRASIRNSINLKKNSETIVEVVSAEDIGKLPDTSIAESIARLPGLTAQRLDGRAQVISIRGLSPDFSTTLLNGREQVSTGDNRGVEYDQYPSELLSGVVVYKTPDASLIGTGLSGTVDLRTYRPLEYGKRTVALNARYERDSEGALNAGSKDYGYRFSATYIDQFADGKIGVALGAAYLDSPIQIERFNAWGYPTTGLGELVLGGAKPFVASDDLKRTGVIGTVEFRPNENFTSTIDAYYSKFEDTQLLRGIEFPLWWGGLPLQPGYTVQDNLVTQGQFNGVKGVVRNDANTRDANLVAFGWNNTWSQGPVTAITDLSYSRVHRKDQILETYAGTGRAGIGATDNLGFTMDGTKGAIFDSTLDYSDPSLILLTSPQGWGGNVVPGGQDGYLNAPSVKDELIHFKTAVRREFEGGIKDVEVGIDLSQRKKSLTQNQFFLGLKANEADPTHSTSVPIPTQFLEGTTKLDFLGIAGMVSYDPFALVDSGIYDLIPNPNADVLSAGWGVEEKIATAYAKADIDSHVGDMQLTGNVGVQIVRTEQSSNGAAASGAPALSVKPIHDGINYTNVLPSMNLALHLSDTTVLRLGLAREMARARMDQMSASINFNFNAGLANSPDLAHSPWSGSGGNPELKPWLADAIDLSIEKYFGRDAYVSAAFFYKNLKSYIFSQSFLYDFTGFPTNGVTPVLHEGFVSIPQNGTGGRIDGVELSVTLPFHMVSPWLEGFGLQASGSYTDSSIVADPNNPAQPLPGLSKWVGNVQIYYEKGGFSARVSDRYRSKFLGEVAGFGDARTFRQVKAENIIDAQLGYEFKSGPAEGLSIVLQANNLTNEPFITYQNGDPRQIIDYMKFGTQYLLGAIYKF